MISLRIYGSKNCKVCEKIKKSLENLKRKDIEYKDIEDLEEEDLKILKKSLGDKKEAEIPVVVDEKENQVCELIVGEDVVLAKCGNKIKVIYEKEYDEAIGALRFFLK